MAGLLGVIGGAVVMIVSLPSDLFGRVPALSGTVDADWPQVAVVDGGTLRLREAVIRLQGVAAPARGRRCGTADASFDCGASATQSLAALVQGHVITCRLAGRDAAGFAVARCDAGGADLNRAQVASGWARADGAEFAELEASARNQRLGMWRSGDAPTF